MGQGGEWSDAGINGMARWMNRVWELAQRDARVLDGLPQDSEALRDLSRTVHKTIRRVVTDLRSLQVQHGPGSADGVQQLVRSCVGARRR